MISINHRGFSSIAPENTLPAYRLSKKMGFHHVETDVSFTADGVAVLLHDATIDRTSNGSGKLSDLTLSQVRQYDFGSWKSPEYRGTKIPTLSEFLELCKELTLFPYIELKRNGKYTQQQIESIVDLVKQYEMEEKSSYISFSPEYLRFVRNYDPSARLGFLRSSVSAEDLEICRNLRTSVNKVFCDVKYSAITQDLCKVFKTEGIPLEAWTVNQAEVILKMNPYVSGITSDCQLAARVLSDFYQSVNTSAEKKAGLIRQTAQKLGAKLWSFRNNS